MWTYKKSLCARCIFFTQGRVVIRRGVDMHHVHVQDPKILTEVSCVGDSKSFYVLYIIIKNKS